MEEIDIINKQEKIKSLLDEMRELGQPRSDFMLSHFVVGQHDTPAVQRKQVLDELQALMFALGDMNDERELFILEAVEIEGQIEKLKGIEKRRAEIKAGQARRKALALELHITGRMKECDTLLAMLDKMPKLTREQYEKEQATYWSLRLTRQFFLGQRGDFGNLDAILQMATEPGKEKPKIPYALENILPLISEELRVLQNVETSRDLPAGDGT